MPGTPDTWRVCGPWKSFITGLNISSSGSARSRASPTSSFTRATTSGARSPSMITAPSRSIVAWTLSGSAEESSRSRVAVGFPSMPQSAFSEYDVYRSVCVVLGKRCRSGAEARHQLGDPFDEGRLVAVVELRPRAQRGRVGDAVDEQPPVEMVGLVLVRAGRQTAHDRVDGRAVLVEGAHLHLDEAVDDTP